MKYGLVRRLLFFVAMFFYGSAIHASQGVNYFNLDSYQGILNDRRQESFLMVMWSLDCPPCVDEMQMLGHFHQQHPDKKIILVSVDTVDQVNEIMQLMQQFGLQDVEQWVFDYAAQHLRYAIDPGWYGELPRSYFHSSNQQRVAVTGRLRREQLVSWFMGNAKN